MATVPCPAEIEKCPLLGHNDEGQVRNLPLRIPRRRSFGRGGRPAGRPYTDIRVSARCFPPGRFRGDVSPPTWDIRVSARVYFAWTLRGNAPAAEMPSSPGLSGLSDPRSPRAGPKCRPPPIFSDRVLWPAPPEYLRQQFFPLLPVRKPSLR